MPKYILEFQKNGMIKYTSHLDMLRLFKRAFKSLMIPLEYSQGFNPHPKMGFAQPLSLGYTGEKELLEFTATCNINTEIILMRLKDMMPEGIDLIALTPWSYGEKTMASMVDSAVYRAILPLNYDSRHVDIEKSLKDYLNQPKIMAKKREKKRKKHIDVDIKPKMRSIKTEKSLDRVALLMELDAGSSSNLNPESVINSFISFTNLSLEVYDVEIVRVTLRFTG